jgi:hypothetical protein
MKLKWNGGGSHNIASMEREGRPCDTSEVLSQIGKMNILAVSGGRIGKLTNTEGDDVGVFLPIDTARRVEVVLDPSDTYTVRRVRHVVRGAHAGHEVVEYELAFVYCDSVGECVYQASCWK